MANRLLTTRSKEARKLARAALERMAQARPVESISTSTIRGEKRDPQFLSTDMIHPQIRKALGQDQADEDGGLYEDGGDEN